MIISEEEKNRIRGLHKNYSIINERVIGTGDTGSEDEFGAPESESALYSYDKDVDRTNIDEDSEGEETFNYGEDEGEDRKEEEGLEHEEDMAPHDRIREIEKHLDALKKDMSYDEDREDRGEEGTQFESVSAKKKALIKEQDLPTTQEIDKIITCIKGALDIDVPSSCILALMTPNPMSIAKCALAGAGDIWDVISSEKNQKVVWGCIPEKYKPKNTDPGIWG